MALPKHFPRAVRWQANHVVLSLPTELSHQSTPPRRRNDSFPAARVTIAGDANMATSSIRVAAAQMTSINELAANFATCSRLVKEAAAGGAKLICFPESFSFIGAHCQRW
ncbi:hypothetical protein ACFX11_001211 [Malus domestica]